MKCCCFSMEENTNSQVFRAHSVLSYEQEVTDCVCTDFLLSPVGSGVFSVLAGPSRGGVLHPGDADWLSGFGLHGWPVRKRLLGLSFVLWFQCWLVGCACSGWAGRSLCWRLCCWRWCSGCWCVCRPHRPSSSPCASVWPRRAPESPSRCTSHVSQTQVINIRARLLCCKKWSHSVLVSFTVQISSIYIMCFTLFWWSLTHLLFLIRALLEY